MKNIIFLWIDDMEQWAQSVQDNLQIIAKRYDVNLHVVHAVNGETLLDQLVNYQFDGILMDYHMEPSNGDEYVREIRFEEHLEHIPIIFYSQDTDADLASLVSDLSNIICVHRPNLEDKIKEVFFES